MPLVQNDLNRNVALCLLIYHNTQISLKINELNAVKWFLHNIMYYELLMQHSTQKQTQIEHILAMYNFVLE